MYVTRKWEYLGNTDLGWCYSDWLDNNVRRNSSSEVRYGHLRSSVGDLGLWWSSSCHQSSRQQYSEVQIHTLFGILSGRRHQRVFEHRLWIHQLYVEPSWTCSWCQLELLLQNEYHANAAEENSRTICVLLKSSECLNNNKEIMILP